MAAGLGFKDFVTGEVLTAADVDGYLMQGVWVFASAAARDAAVTAPQEGNFAYLKDTNVTTYYTGSAWANLDTTGMTNPMTTTGDTIYSSSGSTPARLGIGSTGQVLTVSGGVPTWATAGTSGKLRQVVSATYSTQVSTTSSTFADTGLTVNITPTANDSKVVVFAHCSGIKGNTAPAGLDLRLMRAGSEILYWATNSGYGAGNIGTVSTAYLDSPASTSSLTYKVQFRTQQGSSVLFNDSSSTSMITLMEIGA